MTEEVVVEDVGGKEEAIAETYMEVSVGDKKSFKPFWVMLYG